LEGGGKNMYRYTFLLALLIVLIAFPSACKKTEKAESIALPEGAVQIKIQGEETAPAIPLLFTLDGSLKDWAGIQPLWDEAGVIGQGSFEHDIDIKQVYFKNDAQHLYVFMRTVPTILELFKSSSLGGVLGSLYIDSDNNPGSGAAPMGKMFESEKFKGYEMRIWLPRGVMPVHGQDTPFINYDVRFFEGDDLSQSLSLRWESYSEGTLIAHGPDGVEFALPLDTLRLTLPARVRVLLREESHWSEEQGYSVGMLTLEAPK
jgi:hypothetical protein